MDPISEEPIPVKKPRKPRTPKQVAAPSEAEATIAAAIAKLPPAMSVLNTRRVNVKLPRVTLALRPLKKAYFTSIRRFRVNEHISKVELHLKNGQVISANFVLDKPNPVGYDHETYLLAEDEQSFTIALESSATIPNLRALDIAIIYDDENRPIHTLEY